MATYSLSITAADATNQFAPKLITLDDDRATHNAQRRSMALGNRVLCLNPDGSQGFYKMDAERSNPTRGLIYLLKQ